MRNPLPINQDIGQPYRSTFKAQIPYGRYPTLLQVLRHGTTLTSRRVAKLLSASCREAVEFTRAVPQQLRSAFAPRIIYSSWPITSTHLCLGGLSRGFLLCASTHTWNPWTPPLGLFSASYSPHDRLCDNLHELCRSAGLHSRREQVNCLTNQAPDSQTPPGCCR